MTTRAIHLLRITYAVSAAACICLLLVLGAAIFGTANVESIVSFACLAVLLAVPAMAGIVAWVAENPRRSAPVAAVVLILAAALAAYDFASTKQLIGAGPRSTLAPLAVSVGATAVGAAALFVLDLLGIVRANAILRMSESAGEE